MANFISYWKKLETTHKITLILFVVTFLLSCFNFWRNEQIVDENKNLKFRINSMDYQPKIIVLGTPLVWNEPDTLVVTHEELARKYTTTEIGDTTTHTIKRMFDIRTKLKITNIGNVVGRLLHIVCVDSILSLNDFRNHLSGKKKIESLTKKSWLYVKYSG